MSSKKHTQLAVLGAGPGGYKAAFLAADLGLDTILIDPEKNPGGVCMYRGCVPTKALLHSVHQYRNMLNSKEIGIDTEGVRADLDGIRAYKERVIGQMTENLGSLAKKRRVNHVRGYGGFTSPDSIQVEKVDGGSEEWEFEHALIATGSFPLSLPNVEFDGVNVISSKEALELPKLPSSMLVVGAGFISLELGSVYAGLGSRVTVAEMLPYIMPGADRDLIDEYLRHSGHLFEALKTNTSVETIETGRDGSIVTFQDADGTTSRKEFETVLLTIGRKPNTASLGLENAGVETDKRGFIRVDSQRRSSQPSIFAVGDVTGTPLLAHKAAHEALVAVKTITGQSASYDPYALPAVEYTDPEIAWTGLTEDQAREEGRQVEIGRFPWSASGRAATQGRSDGMTKLIFAPDSHRVLGGGIVGIHAGELISEITLAIETGATADDLGMTIHPHPTLSETVMEAADDLFGRSTHSYRSGRSHQPGK